MDYEYKTRDEAESEWRLAQMTGGCSCHISPPCGWCEQGFSLCLDEFMELYAPPEISEAAMRDGLQEEIKREEPEKKEHFVRGSLRRQFRLPTPF